jgi:hypothetical protein
VSGGVPGPTSHPHRDLWLLVGIVALGAVLRLGYAVDATGMFYPDELFQSLEPAHGVVHGAGLRYWEFEVGARPWTVPGVFVVLFGLLKLLGIAGPGAHTLAARLLDAAITATWPYLCWRLGRALHSARAGRIAAALAAVWWVLILLAPRAFAHTFSLTFALWAVARAAEEPPPPTAAAWRRPFVTGVLLGLAVAFRYQEGLVLVGLVGYLLLQRRGRETPLVLLGAAGPALLVALLDWATWGRPAHSLVTYLQTNLVEGRARSFGQMPWHFYVGRLAAVAGAGGAVLALGAFARRRALLLGATVAATILVAHSVIAHKELRFVLGAAVVLLVIAGCGAASVAEHLAAATGRPRLGALAVALVLALWTAASAATAARVTFADLGLYAGLPEAREQPWRFRRDLNRALTRVGARPDLCGLALFPYGAALGGNRLSSTGGYTYLHRGVPMVVGPPPPALRPLVNYVVSCRGVEPTPRFADLDPVEQVGDCTIYRRPAAAACAAGDLAPFSRQWRWAAAPTATAGPAAPAAPPSTPSIPDGER